MKMSMPWSEVRCLQECAIVPIPYFLKLTLG